MPELEMVRVPIDSLAPNAYNPNVQDARTYTAERESIRTYGFVDPVTVRTLGDNGDGKYVIIDGEHRWRAAKDEGHTEIDIIPLDLTDDAAKKLTVILNETRGQADTVPLARLLNDLMKDTTVENLMLGLPYERAQLDELLKIGSIDWDTFNAGRAEEVEQHIRLRQGKNQYTVFLNFDKPQKEKYDTYTGMLAREKGENYTVEQAVVDALAVLCKAL